MLKAFEYRLYPDEDQKILIHKHIGAVRWLYNWGLNKKVETWKQEQKTLNRYDLQKTIPSMKNTEETSWLKEVNSQSLQSSLIHLDEAYSKFFKKTAGFPKFKSKKTAKQSFEIPQKLKVDFDHGCIDLPKFTAPLKARFHRQFTGQIRTCTIKKTPTGKYFVSILVEDGLAVPAKQEPVFKESIGIDVGIKDFAVTSEGEVFENPRHLIKTQDKLAKLQQSFSRKLKLNKGKPLGKNASKLKQEIALVHEKIANQRKDFLHKVSTRLIRENQSVCVEDLNVKGMLANKNLAKHVQDLGLGMFYGFLQYKADWSGKYVLECGRWDASSKTCSKCGHYYKELTLDQRVWTCASCGEVHHRDVNAAWNIKDMAFMRHTSSLSSTGNSGAVSVKVTKVTDGKKAKAVAPGKVLLGQKKVSVKILNKAVPSLAPR